MIWRDKKPEIFCGTLCLLSVIALISILTERYLYVESKNAVLAAYLTPLAPEVAGEITRVFVKENQPVRAGQILCQLDDRPYREALGSLQGQGDSVRVQWRNSQQDLKRADYLFRNGAINHSRFDQAVANEQSFAQRFSAIQARVSIAKSNWMRTRVTAPRDGVISFRSARVGMFAPVGFPLFGFVADQKKWVMAKVKETDLKGIRVGDSVSLWFDASPGRRYAGRVEDISPASEAIFSSVPDDFSSGNYTKYSQWFPIRISLEEGVEASGAALPIGTNSEIRIRRRHGSARAGFNS